MNEEQNKGEEKKKDVKPKKKPEKDTKTLREGLDEVMGKEAAESFMRNLAEKLAKKVATSVAPQGDSSIIKDLMMYSSMMLVLQYAVKKHGFGTVLSEINEINSIHPKFASFFETDEFNEIHEQMWCQIKQGARMINSKEKLGELITKSRSDYEKP